MLTAGKASAKDQGMGGPFKGPATIHRVRRVLLLNYMGHQDFLVGGENRVVAFDEDKGDNFGCGVGSGGVGKRMDHTAGVDGGRDRSMS